MEPITAIMLSAALVGGLPSFSRFGVPKEDKKDPSFVSLDADIYVNHYSKSVFSDPQSNSSFSISFKKYNDFRMGADVVNSIEILSDENVKYSYINNVYAELASYQDFEDGWDGEGSLRPKDHDVNRAIDFITSLPSFMPLPICMLSPNGTIGLYWDDGVNYADLNFDDDGSISLYTRARNTTPEKERFVNGIRSYDMNEKWFFSELAAFINPLAIAA